MVCGRTGVFGAHVQPHVDQEVNPEAGTAVIQNRGMAGTCVLETVLNTEAAVFPIVQVCCNLHHLHVR